MPATLESPSQSPSGVTIVESQTPLRNPPAPTSEIHLNPSTKLTDPPKPGSARERMFKSLQDKAKGASPAPVTTPESTPAQRPADPTENPTPDTDPQQSAGPDQSNQADQPGQPSAAPADKTTAKGERVNPWKLVDQYKAKTAELEKQVAESRTAALPEKERNTYLTQIQELTTQNKALQDEMRFVNYEQTPEFKEKYDAPYERAWKRALSEISEISVADPQTGQERPMSQNDLWELLNLPLGQATKVATEKYGDLAAPVLQHRAAIRDLLQQRQEAIESAKKMGGERDKVRREMFAKQQKEMADHLASVWKSANESLLSDEKISRYFKPVEGDQEGNLRLQKGYELVDRAFSENVNDPRLTPQQRADVVRRHAAVRNRAASWGRLRYENEKKDARIAELEKEVSQYKGTSPRTQASNGASTEPNAPASTRSQVFGALRALAK